MGRQVHVCRIAGDAGNGFMAWWSGWVTERSRERLGGSGSGPCWEEVSSDIASRWRNDRCRWVFIIIGSPSSLRPKDHASAQHDPPFPRPGQTSHGSFPVSSAVGYSVGLYTGPKLEGKWHPPRSRCHQVERAGYRGLRVIVPVSFMW
jgi:hypothetical protein